MKKVFRKEIKIDFLEISIWVCFSDDVKKQNSWWCKEILKCEEKEIDKDGVTGALSNSEITYYKEYLLSYPFNVQIDHLVHECYHVIRKISIVHGLEQHNKTDETSCYLMGWLVKEVCRLKKLANKKPSIKRV